VTDEVRAQASGAQCPTCARPVAWLGNPTRPFCSVACRLIDLGHWLDGRFRIPGAPLSLPDSSSPVDPAADE
jgi:endogenous inhibitor of DNA gyrase (YacG/DUF329 family)